jgi:hypothetical protein
MILFVVVVGWGNRHQWYQLPFVPIAAALAGCACVRIHAAIRNRRAFVAIGAALVLVAFASLSYVYAARLYVPSAERLRRLGFELNKRTPPAAIIIAAVDGNPAVFYYARRKGWHFLEKDGVFDGNPLDSEQLIADFDKLRARGATHLVFDWSVRWWLEYYGEFADHLARTSKLVEKTPSFSIYELNRTEP